MTVARKKFQTRITSVPKMKPKAAGSSVRNADRGCTRKSRKNSSKEKAEERAQLMMAPIPPAMMNFPMMLLRAMVDCWSGSGVAYYVCELEGRRDRKPLF